MEDPQLPQLTRLIYEAPDTFAYLDGAVVRAKSGAKATAASFEKKLSIINHADFPLLSQLLNPIVL